MGLLVQMLRPQSIQFEPVNEHPLSEQKEDDLDEFGPSPFMLPPAKFGFPPRGQQNLTGEFECLGSQESWVLVDVSEPHGQDIDPNIHVSERTSMADIVNIGSCGILQMGSGKEAAPRNSVHPGGSGRGCNSIVNGSCRRHPGPWNPAGNPELQIPLDLSSDDIIFDHPKQFIGAGGFAKVYRAQFPPGRDVAVKQVAREFSGEIEASSIASELRMLSVLGSHRNLVQCYGGSVNPPNIFVVEELMEHDLHSLIHPGGAGLTIDSRPRPMPVRQILKIGLDVAHGLQHMHPNHVHRDVKPKNILMKAGLAKLADFGLSKTKKATYVSRLNSKGLLGTVNYMSPECILGKEMHQSDIYSFAIVLWECLTGRSPFLKFESVHFMTVMYNVQHNKVRPEFPKDLFCPEGLKQLIVDCWHEDPRKRPECPEIIDRLYTIAHDCFGSSRDFGYENSDHVDI